MTSEVKPIGTAFGLSNDIIRDFVKTFDTPHGRRVLDRLESRPYSLIRIDQHPSPTYPNPAFLSPNAALYRAGMIDTVKYCRRVVAKSQDLEPAVPSITEST